MGAPGCREGSGRMSMWMRMRPGAYMHAVPSVSGTRCARSGMQKRGSFHDMDRCVGRRSMVGWEVAPGGTGLEDAGSPQLPGGSRAPGLQGCASHAGLAAPKPEVGGWPGRLSSPSTSSTSGEYLLELPYHLQQGKEGRGRPDVDRPRCTGTGRWTHDAWTGQASGDFESGAASRLRGPITHGAQGRKELWWEAAWQGRVDATWEREREGVHVGRPRWGWNRDLLPQMRIPRLSMLTLSGHLHQIPRFPALDPRLLSRWPAMDSPPPSTARYSSQHAEPSSARGTTTISHQQKAILFSPSAVDAAAATALLGGCNLGQKGGWRSRAGARIRRRGTTLPTADSSALPSMRTRTSKAQGAPSHERQAASAATRNFQSNPINKAFDLAGWASAKAQLQPEAEGGAQSPFPVPPKCTAAVSPLHSSRCRLRIIIASINHIAPSTSIAIIPLPTCDCICHPRPPIDSTSAGPVTDPDPFSAAAHPKRSASCAAVHRLSTIDRPTARNTCRGCGTTSSTLPAVRYEPPSSTPSTTMDEKRSRSASQTEPCPDPRGAAMPGRFRHALRMVLSLVVLSGVLYHVWNGAPQLSRHGVATSPVSGVTKVKGLVPLEAHIISKCPDTRDALRQLILPAMQRVHDKVDFKLNYIGTPTANDGVECKHGPSECLGNIIELCARELYPDPKINLGFIMCLTKDYKHIPERALIEDCALEHAIDFQSLNECATRDDGAHGLELLRTSVERTAEPG
ncbi:hypothetical protein Purlil1_11534 [Purpureocillium lilacinum]|uniref:Gamma interferon inducible lysosomal thiol reductase GILT n=1 Tax=Purpureocillium lilacinum TaxID=33203 RepID=A0ABR0BKH7_PURLI|nr:hypothetical protein Purlil1_11534 [Purpureocillium lilacinum]